MSKHSVSKYRTKKLGSYPYVSVVFSITLALFAIGIFGTLIIYSGELEQIVRDNVKIQVYLKNELTTEELRQIAVKLKATQFVSKKDAAHAIQFVSKQEAARQFIEETGEDFNKFLGENPLRNAFLVKIDPSFHNKKGLTKIKLTIEKIPGVFQVYYIENVIDSINENITKIGLITVGLVAILFFTVVLLINNTIKLALFSQRFIIRSMQLVGAKRWFIKQPFLFRAVWQGTLSGLISSALLYGTILLTTEKIPELSIIQNTNLLLQLGGAMIVISILVAVISTYFAVTKYLRLSLDELF